MRRDGGQAMPWRTFPEAHKPDRARRPPGPRRPCRHDWRWRPCRWARGGWRAVVAPQLAAAGRDRKP